MATINDFKANLLGAGLRANRFEVFIPRTGSKIQFLCKTGALPGQTIEPVEIVHKGLTFNIAGNRSFEDWTVGIYNDSEFSARNAVEEWMSTIVPMDDSSVASLGYEYMVDKATISQLGRDDSVVATYEFYNMWPTSIAAIDMDTSGGEEITTTEVTFKYSHFERVL
jgi:hypothetical protein